ncbi:uncharacterized protein LOC129303837 [Prosopis cineraria]|uniref:uncharacterized protein LOC129303837 n=1 Tax=Prosopis cineraria TaxID=364024 RepID=UPI00240EAE2C|nr:uncharacterized protein LOC129303837 [Prosopis cineraria]
MQLSFVKALNETNYDDWKESLNMYLAISKKDLALREPKPADLSSKFSASEMAFHKQWSESNQISLAIIKYTIEKRIRDSIPEKDTTVEYLKAVGNKYKKLDKTQKNYYLSLLDNTRYDGVSGVREHILKLVHYYNKLKSYGIDLVKSTLVYRVLQSLPSEYTFLRTSYNSQEAE